MTVLHGMNAHVFRVQIEAPLSEVQPTPTPPTAGGGGARRVVSSDGKAAAVTMIAAAAMTHRILSAFFFKKMPGVASSKLSRGIDPTLAMVNLSAAMQYLTGRPFRTLGCVRPLWCEHC